MCKNRYGITYNKTLLREHGWELPNSFAELEELAAKAKEAGMDEHLSKPVDIDALEQAVKRFRVTPPPLSQVKKLAQHSNSIFAICNSTLLLLH